MGDPFKVTVVRAYFELPGFENIGGEYQNTILIPAYVGIFYLLPF